MHNFSQSQSTESQKLPTKSAGKRTALNYTSTPLLISEHSPKRSRPKIEYSGRSKDYNCVTKRHAPSRILPHRAFADVMTTSPTRVSVRSCVISAKISRSRVETIHSTPESPLMGPIWHVGRATVARGNASQKTVINTAWLFKKAILPEYGSHHLSSTLPPPSTV